MFGGKAILVADEQPLCREGLAAMLTRCDAASRTIQVDRFSTLISALADDGNIALAVVDLDLPGLAGIAGIRQLRFRYPTVRIVVMAAVMQRDAVVDCLRVGVHGWVHKFVAVEAFIEALDTIAKGRIFVPDIVCEEQAEQSAPITASALSERQHEVLTILAAGKSNKEIARQLGIAEGTVKVHVNAVFRALGVHNRIGAAAALRSFERVPALVEPALPGLLHPFRRATDRKHA